MDSRDEREQLIPDQQLQSGIPPPEIRTWLRPQTHPPRARCELTFIVVEVSNGGPGLVVAEEGDVGGQAAVDAVGSAADTFLPQIPHEELQADESKDAQAEDGKDHHISQLLHRLD